MKTYTIPEVAKKLGVGVHAVYATIRKGKLKATPGIMVVSERDLNRYLQAHGKKEGPQESESQTFVPLFFRE